MERPQCLRPCYARYPALAKNLDIYRIFMMSESHLPACIKYTNRTERICRAATIITEVFGASLLATSLYELGSALVNVSQLDLDSAEQQAYGGLVCGGGTLGFWAVGMVVVPAIQKAFTDRIHHRTSCSWDDEWQTDGGSGARPTA